MYYCLVCKTSCALWSNLQNHMLRHRKVDLISAVNKLPSESPNHLCTHAPSSACTSKCLIGSPKEKSDKSLVAVKQEIDFDDEELTINVSNLEQANVNFGSEIKQDSKLRRSCRLKYSLGHVDSDKCGDLSFDRIEDNYYIPPSVDGQSSKSNSLLSDDSDEDIKPTKRAKLRKKSSSRYEGKQKIEPILTTPKVKKDPSSETDSCSGNAHSEPHTFERMFCSYCGSGYRTESMLADHIRHNHFNFCATCEVNFPDVHRFREHTQKHRNKVYVCPYCAIEFDDRDELTPHLQRHLHDAALDNVLSLEEEYFSERTYMNTMYNMFNAGYTYGRRVGAADGVGSGCAAAVPTEFYQVFLQYASQDVDRVERYGYLCRTCGFTLFDRSHYRDHMQIAHSVTPSDMERLLSI